MQKKAVFVSALVLATLAGCGSKTDANEKNFGAALNQYFEKKGELCLGVTQWPLELSEADLRLLKTMPTGNAGRMAALEAAGLVSSTEAEIEGKSFLTGKPNGLKFKVKRYTVSEAGKSFYREKDVDSISLNGVKKVKQGDLCYGRKALDKVVKWEGPIKLGEYQEASVKYLYKVEGLADWAKSREIESSFPQVAQILEGAGTRTLSHSVKLTSEGWEAKGLD